MSIVDSFFNDFGTYPLNIFSSGLQLLLTFGIPVAFHGLFPSRGAVRTVGGTPAPSTLRVRRAAGRSILDGDCLVAV